MITYFEKNNGNRVEISFDKANNLLFIGVLEKVVHTKSVMIVRQKNRPKPPAQKPLNYGGGGVFSKEGKNGAWVMGERRTLPDKRK